MGNYLYKKNDMDWDIIYDEDENWKIEYYNSMWLCIRGRSYKVNSRNTPNTTPNT